MYKKIIPILTLIAVLATACAAQPSEPTLSPEEVQSTAISGALTIVAQTQAAIPTATPLPPTETPSPTPLPTFTPLPLPTLDLAILPTATTAPSTSGGTCSGLLNIAEAGPQSGVRFENVSSGTAALSLFMYTANAFAQCGNMPSNPYILAPGAKLVVSLPKGNYYAYAWITHKNGDQSSAEGYFWVKPADNHTFPVLIKDDVIVDK